MIQRSSVFGSEIPVSGLCSKSNLIIVINGKSANKKLLTDIGKINKNSIFVLDLTSDNFLLGNIIFDEYSENNWQGYHTIQQMEQTDKYNLIIQLDQAVDKNILENLEDSLVGYLNFETVVVGTGSPAQYLQEQSILKLGELCTHYRNRFVGAQVKIEQSSGLEVDTINQISGRGFTKGNDVFLVTDNSIIHMSIDTWGGRGIITDLQELS